MRDFGLLFAVGVVSALVPVVNIEAYLALREAVSEGDPLWAAAFVAAAGQMTGKLVWYRVGASSLGWGWVRRQVERPKAQARLALWQQRTRDRPVIAGSLVLVSATVGLPPFAILAVVAGQLRMNLALFLTLGLLGRWVRFAAVLGGVSWLEGTALV